MATYTLISSNVLTSSAASVTFSAIPATYTDLVLKLSARCDNASTSLTVYVTYNALATDYSRTMLRGNGATATSVRGSSETSFSGFGFSNGDTSTANTFSSGEIYIPSYTASQSKPSSAFTAWENNATTAFIYADAFLQSSTDAITSITLDPESTNNFKSGSSFYLYGISNA
jgi:hypothetical protein